MISVPHTSYIIVTKAMGWKVSRKYSEFTVLREILVKEFPGLYVPAIQKKKKLANFDDEATNRLSIQLEVADSRHTTFSIS